MSTSLSSPHVSFRDDLYNEPTEYEETALRDRKSDFPCMSSPDKKAEFLRDFIALSNTARMLGRPAYLLYGLSDNIPPDLCDIQEYLGEYGEGGAERIWEIARNRIGQAVESYVQPVGASFELKHSRISGRLVAYLIIHPQATEEPFCVRRSLKARRGLVAGQSWIRFGESKADISNRLSLGAAPWQYCWARAPYPLPSAWLRLYQGLLDDRALIEALSIEPYQKLCTTSGASLDAEVEDLLKDEEQLLVVYGPAGCGKSAWIRRLVYTMAEAGEAAVQQMREREDFSTPPSRLPVYFPLRSASFENSTQLARDIVREANRYGGLWDSEPSEPELLLGGLKLNWLVCFDGLDEIWDYALQRSFLGMLRTLMRRYPKLEVVLTTRPDCIVPNDLGRQVTVVPLTPGQVESFLAHYVDDLTYQSIMSLIESSEDLGKLCSVPLFLSAVSESISRESVPTIDEAGLSAEFAPALHHVSDVAEVRARVPASSIPRAGGARLILQEPVTNEGNGSADEKPDDEYSPGLPLGWVLDRAYSRLCSRETQRRLVPLEDVDDWWNGLGQLALYVDGHRHSVRAGVIRQRYILGEGLHWILSLGLLMRARAGWHTFSTYLTQLAMAAQYLQPFAEGRVYEDCRGLGYLEHCGEGFKSMLREIMYGMTYRQEVDDLFKEVDSVQKA